MALILPPLFLILVFLRSGPELAVRGILTVVAPGVPVDHEHVLGVGQLLFEVLLFGHQLTDTRPTLLYGTHLVRQWIGVKISKIYYTQIMSVYIS